ncbi:MAG: hydroxyacylglutathione hydrolase [Nitriliruptoraceae bacterium]|jgi:hydroxyacylglutathione hydrolase
MTALVLLAALVGVSLGLLGGGGSILLVPLLVYVGGMEPTEAVVTSLVVVGITSAVGAGPHAWSGRISWRTAAVFGPAGMVGAYAGGLMGARVPGQVLLIAFAVVATVTAVAMLSGNGRSSAPPHTGSSRWVRIAGEGLVVGAVTGFVGAGGGFLVVPALVLMGGLAMPEAIATSLVIIAMKSAAAVGGYLTTVDIDWGTVAPVTAAAAIGALVGASQVHRVPSERLRGVFGVFVLAAASLVLFREAPSPAVLWALAPPVAGIAAYLVQRRRAVATAPLDQPGSQQLNINHHPTSTDHDRSTTMHVVIIETPSLGDRSYLVHDGHVGLVVDPQRDVDRVEAALIEAGVRLGAVLETHVHNDYVSGGLELSQRHQAVYAVAADEDVAFDRYSVRDGDSLTVGALQVRVVHTPGHTPTHLSYVVSTDGEDHAVLTGGGLLYGSVGRTDLIGADRTDELTRAQYRSAHRLADALDDAVQVLPTHGFGSFCSSGDTSGATESTIGEERVRNQALTANDEDAFVAELLAGLDAWPAYYAHMAPLNRNGPAPVDLTPPAQVDGAELQRRLHAGEWVVDLRSRRAYADGHLVGTVNVELADSMSTYLGWILDWGVPLTLIADTPDDITQAQRQLVRIGVDRLAGQATTDDARDSHDGQYRVAGFDDLLTARVTQGLTILDTRLVSEWEDGHLPGALHIPLHELLPRLHELPDAPVWVHCASGYRAGIAASIVARTGREVVLVDGELADAMSRLETTP